MIARKLFLNAITQRAIQFTKETRSSSLQSESQHSEKQQSQQQQQQQQQQLLQHSQQQDRFKEKTYTSLSLL
jgi:hypothetical protein